MDCKHGRLALEALSPTRWVSDTCWVEARRGEEQQQKGRKLESRNTMKFSEKEVAE
jgi:hypothetical protein